MRRERGRSLRRPPPTEGQEGVGPAETQPTQSPEEAGPAEAPPTGNMEAVGPAEAPPTERPEGEGDPAEAMMSLEGEGCSPAHTPSIKDETIQAKGGIRAPGDPLKPLDECLDALLNNAQFPKRPLSESSSESVPFSEKRGRHASTSGSSSGEEPRVFPSDSPNEVSFLSIALQSTPRPLPIRGKKRGDRAPAPPLSPTREKGESSPQSPAERPF